MVPSLSGGVLGASVADKRPKPNQHSGTGRTPGLSFSRGPSLSLSLSRQPLAPWSALQLGGRGEARASAPQYPDPTRDNAWVPPFPLSPVVSSSCSPSTWCFFVALLQLRVRTGSRSSYTCCPAKVNGNEERLPSHFFLASLSTCSVSLVRWR